VSRLNLQLSRIVILIFIMLIISSACSAASITTSVTNPESKASTTSIKITPDALPSIIRVAALKGPTGIGLVSLMEEASLKKTVDSYDFMLSAAPDDLVAKLSSGEVDIAALPTNLAASLYQKTNGRVKLLAINTLGVLYILENGSTIKSIADLKGKSIAATGQGAIPEYALNAILNDANLSDLTTVTYLQEHAELATQAIAGKYNLIMLPEPFVTTVLNKAPQFRIAINLTEAFAAATQKNTGSKSELAMGCLVVRTDFAERNTEAIKRFMRAYQASTQWVNAHKDEAGELVAKYTIMADAKAAAKSIPNCNIVFVAGNDMKPMIEPLFKILFTANPKSIGGKLPDDLFYYVSP
jgi:NitT/TauT family transport system substrate-binding protein